MCCRYELLVAPAGAVIDAEGVITWTPTESQGPSTNTITTVVTDNGVPPLSVTNSFTVTVSEVNTAPVLPAQADRSLDELTLLTVTNTATDADVPANVLSYELLVCAGRRGHRWRGCDQLDADGEPGAEHQHDYHRRH